MVSANYRFVTTDPFPAPMLDAARVIQYLRYHAQAFNINPDRIILAGSSAGANMSLWIALHDDLAHPKNPDPILRESTRVNGVIAYNGQCLNDPEFILQYIGGSKEVHPSFLPFYGIDSLDEFFNSEKLKVLAQEASSINHVSADDPPILLIYKAKLTKTHLPEDTPTGTSIHHLYFGVLLQKKLKTAKVPCFLFYSGEEAPKDVELKFLTIYFKD